jgi:methyl-accepting chemotaxis protein
MIAIIGAFGFLAFSANASAYRYIDEFQHSLMTHYRSNGFLMELRRVHAEAVRSLHGDAGTTLPAAWQESAATLMPLLDRVAENPTGYREIEYRLRAIRNGIGVYVDLVPRSIAGYAAGESDYYRHFAMADRIVWYLERYLSELQNLRLTEGWRYYQEQSSQAGEMRTILVIALGVVLLMSLNFSFGFAFSFTKPIRTLAAMSTRLAAGDLAVPALEFKGHKDDEMGDLVRAFNSMSASIRASVRELEGKIQLERGLREAQLLKLQAQIRPHFFFNALNTLARQAQLEEAPKTAGLIRTMASLIRYNISSLKSVVNLG